MLFIILLVMWTGYELVQAVLWRSWLSTPQPPRSPYPARGFHGKPFVSRHGSSFCRHATSRPARWYPK